ncbi:serine/threonine-protein kinase ATG1c isoform X3 [Arachis ipaensis]|uniref:serine/threonine-protein kinase ATG1c isoform X3 n=1 Tax=Arachis ipaensis TaxID=130454 RepID=UPI000A2B874F|nr:serine/threonine-protein kinase ATG1c isoform X3 [Arachis ipaensis]XP_025633507.1 serine/threonine-protein kinase ATG1c isoform X3 [Arachis hypogaea]
MAMAQGTGIGRSSSMNSSSSSRVIGEYIVGREIGSGSFSRVWHGRHKVHGTEVAIKEIATHRLNNKLHDSLMSEIFILKRIKHPNIIRLHDIIQAPGKIHLVLEYCKGGDLYFYIQRRGRVQEATAKHFMQQLADGLQVLRDNNVIHRDLKPQNLLLSRNDEKSVLKIADFGFARSLQPRGLAETLCGSPLYMAPEIMQLQKYDAKADLWSVGAILFQLVIGRTPFTGNNQIQLLQNIMKSTELVFPSDCQSLSSDCKDLCQKLLRRNPVERLTFEEFFNHPFLSEKQPEQIELLRNRSSSRLVGGFSSAESDPLRKTEENYQEDCLPFFLDDDSSGLEGSPSFSKKSSIKSTIGFDLSTKLDKPEPASPVANNINYTSRYSSVTQRPESTTKRLDNPKVSGRNLTGPLEPLEQRFTDSHSKDSLENIDQDYVLVSGPPIDVSSSSVSASKPSHSPFKSSSLPQESSKTITRLSAPMPIVGVSTSSTCQIGSSESQDSAPGTSHGSMDTGDEQPSGHCMTRIKSLQQCASAITELVNEKMESGKPLEAFSVQLVILAIWKQALHICHTRAASAMEGSPNQETLRYRRTASKKHGSSDSEECFDGNTQGSKDMLAQIESEFLKEFEHAEELAKAIEPGNTEMPDAMETIFQSALAFGKHGGVEELMGDMESAAALYSKAVRLLLFLLVEAPSLILNPPFSLTNSDRYRLRNYIDILNNRQGYSRSQRMTLLKCDDSRGIFKEKF